MAIKVHHAVYGAIDGNHVPRAEDVTTAFQKLIDTNVDLTISNENMGGDPAVGVVKHFGAIVEFTDGFREGYWYAFACQEGQTIDLGRADPCKTRPAPITGH